MISGNLSRTTLVILALLPVAAFTQDNSAYRSVMAAFAAHKHSEVKFRETKTMDILDAPLEQRGVMTYIAPDVVIKDVQEPSHERYEIRGNNFTAVRNGKRKVLRMDEVPMARAFIESFRAILSGDVVTLETYYTVDFTGTYDNWVLNLVPIDVDLKRKLKRLLWRGRGDRVKTITIEEFNGDTTQMRLTHVASTSHDVSR